MYPDRNPTSDANLRGDKFHLHTVVQELVRATDSSSNLPEPDRLSQADHRHPNLSRPTHALGHIANDACSDDFDNSAIVVLGVDLSPQLSRDAFFSSGFCNESGFKYGMRQRLFAIHMLTRSNRTNRGGSVMMIGSPDDHRVDPVAFRFDHFAIVGVAAWFKVVFSISIALALSR